MRNISYYLSGVKGFLREMLVGSNLTIWVAIVVGAVLITWMLTLGWDITPGESRVGPTVPDFVQPWVTSTTDG